jgi:predicted nucleotidyltransferase
METLTIDRLRAAVTEVLKESPEVAAAYLYGSQARGSTQPLSDIDLAFVLREDFRPKDPLIAERLAARIASTLRTPVEVDAHVAEDLPLPVRGRVVTTGILLYERDPARRVDFETSTRRLYFDFLPLLERDAREGLLARG